MGDWASSYELAYSLLGIYGTQSEIWLAWSAIGEGTREEVT
jgi:hypothetical protein